MVEIRECVEGDPDLLERHMPTGGHQAHAGHFARQRAGSATYLVAWRQASPVGTCLILWDGPVAAETRNALPDAVEISNVHVHPDARGHGVGTALIQAAEERISTRGRSTVTIGVAVDNPRAANLYVRLGYRDTGLRSTARYTYPDTDGVEREVVEHDMTLTKRIEAFPPTDTIGTKAEV
jgi:ribosomal protein S18 acetylase RimI-like enzyme